MLIISYQGGIMYRRGFTQIDLAVSLAMGMILSALALPTVQQAREKSKQEMCAERVTQFTMATLEYQEVNGKVPPVNTGDEVAANGETSMGENQLTGSIAYLLPFIERQDLFELLPPIATQPELTLADSQFEDVGAFLVDPNVATVYNEQVPEWICPANAELVDAPVQQVVAGIQLFPFEVNLESFPNVATLNATVGPTTTDFGRTSYLPIMGSHAGKITNDSFTIDYLDSFGPFRNRVSSLATNELEDGASNTLFWGESLGDIVPVGSIQNDTNQPLLFTAHSSIFQSGLLTGYAFGFTGKDPLVFDFFGNSEKSTFWLVGSNHPGGNNVSFCDGSVKFLSNRINRRVYMWLGSGSDGFYDNRE